MPKPYPLNNAEMPKLLEIDSILKDKSYSSDHLLVLKFLSDLNYDNPIGLKYLFQSELDQLIGFMKPGVPKRRLTILLNNGYTGGGGGGTTTASATTASSSSASSSSASSSSASSSSASSACPAPPQVPMAFNPGGECQFCLEDTDTHTSCGHQLCVTCLHLLSLNQCGFCEKQVTELFKNNAVPSRKIHPNMQTPAGKALFGAQINAMREFLAPNANDNTADI
jgi:hypothetical protein